MKRTLTIVVALVAALAIGGILSGCQQLGIGAPSGMPQKKTAQVGTPALKQEGVLRVGVNAANAPFSTEVNGRLVGIDVDMAAALATELGLTLEVTDVGTEGEKALSQGTVDVIMGMDKLDTAATCWLSDPYIETAVGLFATSSGAIMPSADSKPTIEAQESSMSAWEVTNQFGEDALKAVPDLKTAFDDLASGSTTFVASDVVIGSYINRTSGTNAQIVGLLQTPGGYCVGVPASNNDLKMAISNAVDAIDSNGVAGVIQKKWMGDVLDLSGYTLSDAAAKAAGVDKKKDKEVGGVGSNAVDPSEGQTEGATDANAAAVVVESEPVYEETVYNDYSNNDYSNNDYSGGNQTYEDNSGGGDTGYVEPVNEEPVVEDNTGGEAEYTESVEDNSGGEDTVETDEAA